MISWKIKNNVIHDLDINGENIILPWGIETADSWSFYSQEKFVGYRYKVLNEKLISDTKIFKIEQHVEMNQGEWVIKSSNEIAGNRVFRNAKLICLKDSCFMDFVVRFRFKKDVFNHAEIASHKIFHKSSNIYHQYPVRKVELFGDRFNAEIQIISSEMADKFSVNMYVRDQLDEWIVHARLIPTSEENIVIKLCSKYFKTSPIPKYLTNILMKSKYLKNYLWYRSEHSPYKTKIGKFFNLNAFPLASLKAGEELDLQVELILNEK